MSMAWHEKFKRAWFNLRMAHEATVLDQLQQQSQLVNRLVRKTQNGTVGKETSEPEDAGADEMGVKIGDEYHYHLQAMGNVPVVEGAPVIVAPPPVSANTPAVAPAAKLPAVVKAAVVAGGLLGTGGIAVLADRALEQAPPPTPVVAPVANDGWLEYDLRLTPPAKTPGE